MIRPRDVQALAARHRFLLLVLAAAGMAFSDYYGPAIFGVGAHHHSPASAQASVHASAAHPSDGPRSTDGPAHTPAPRPSRSGSTAAVLPDLVGVTLSAAEKRAGAAGFHRVDSHDARATDRVQIVDENWRVCGQSPAPGREPTATHVSLAVVKLAESCSPGPPARSGSSTPRPTATTITSAPARMPNLVGESIGQAESTLGGVSIHYVDASGKGRFMIVPSHWRVCSTLPAAGAQRSKNAAVTLRAVKTDEVCSAG